MRSLSRTLAFLGLMGGGMSPASLTFGTDLPVTAQDGVSTEAVPESKRLSAFVGLFSQYVSRGFTYSHEEPVIQGGIEYRHPNGWYGGLWVSNVSSATINNASWETDPYGGYSGSIGDLSYDVGFWRWTFPGGKYNVSRVKYDTLEVYAGATYRFLNIKYWRELSDYFGYNSHSAVPDLGVAPNGNSKASRYIEANLNFELPEGFSLGFHVGHQAIRNYEKFNFTDYKISIDKDLGNGCLASVAYSDTNANATLYTDAQGLNTTHSKWLASIKRTF